jgi:threonine dehydrogenase-like Zn-dependent dehydrogenase
LSRAEFSHPVPRPRFKPENIENARFVKAVYSPAGQEMKAVAVFPGNKQFKVIRDFPEPRIESPKQIKVRMLDVGICGTDKDIVHFQYGTPPAGSPYLVIGHESLGEVVETGADVSQFHKGDLVVLSVRRPCDHPDCIACRSGRQDFCYTGDFTERGIKERHGYMTELVVEDAQYAFPVPHELRDVAVLVEPLTIAEKAVEQLWAVQQRLPWAHRLKPGTQAASWNQRVLVLGAGPVGLLGAMKFVIEGFETFIYSRVDGSNARVDIANQIGAKFIDASLVDADGIVKVVGRIDLVYEAVGASNLAFQVMTCLAINGVFIFTGVPGRKEPMHVDTSLFMRNHVLKNQVIFGTVNAGPDSFKSAITDIGEFHHRWPDAIRAIITHRLCIDDAEQPLAGKVPGIKNVISVAQ